VDLRGLLAARAVASFPGPGAFRGCSRGRGPLAGLSRTARSAGLLATGGSTPVLGAARHHPGALEDLLEDCLGDVPFGEALCALAIPVCDLADAEPLTLLSDEFPGSSSPLMREVARATAGGPTYFPPVRMELGPFERWLTDGAVVANHPATIAYAEALRRAEPAEMTVLSLGSGRPRSRARHRLPSDDRRKEPRPALNLLDALAHSSNESAHAALETLVTDPDRYLRIQTTLDGCSPDQDSVERANVDALVALAEQNVADNRPQLERTLKQLTV
jgi:hypothetical protein